MEIKNIDGLSLKEIKGLIQQGAKFVIFPYAISIIIMSFKRNSSIYFIRPNENSFKYSYAHFGVNILFGWWGIPWGPIYTIGALFSHITGGKDITQIVLSELIQNDPEANTSTYNINNTTNSANQTYNIPT
jgi:hypothetical protein